jgi:hypothetical protein
MFSALPCDMARLFMLDAWNNTPDGIRLQVGVRTKAASVQELKKRSAAGTMNGMPRTQSFSNFEASRTAMDNRHARALAWWSMSARDRPVARAHGLPIPPPPK